MNEEHEEHEEQPSGTSTSGILSRLGIPTLTTLYRDGIGFRTSSGRPYTMRFSNVPLNLLRLGTLATQIPGSLLSGLLLFASGGVAASNCTPQNPEENIFFTSPSNTSSTTYAVKLFLNSERTGAFDDALSQLTEGACNVDVVDFLDRTWCLIWEAYESGNYGNETCFDVKLYTEIGANITESLQECLENLINTSYDHRNDFAIGMWSVIAAGFGCICLCAIKRAYYRHYSTQRSHDSTTIRAHSNQEVGPEGSDEEILIEIAEAEAENNVVIGGHDVPERQPTIIQPKKLTNEERLKKLVEAGIVGEKDVASEFVCTVELHIMNKPYSTNAGGSYEYETALELKKLNSLSPMKKTDSNGKVIRITDVFPNDNLCTSINNWLERKEKKLKKQLEKDDVIISVKKGSLNTNEKDTDTDEDGEPKETTPLMLH